MEVFSTTANQIAFLFLLMAIGFVLVKVGWLKGETSNILGKLESVLLLPAVIVESMVDNFSVDKIASLGNLFFWGAIVMVVIIPLAFMVGRRFSKDRFLSNTYVYGLIFSNGGYMGNAVMQALFPALFYEYVIVTLPKLVIAYIWGVPVLLNADENEKPSIKERLKKFINPMCISVLVGMTIGILQIPVPMFVGKTISTLSDCMSPIAMLLIGIAVANTEWKAIFTNVRVYIVSVLRLIAVPLVLLVLLLVAKAPEDIITCTVCWAAMPLGLNPLVMASAYGEDTTESAGMVILSHLLSFVTIPLILVVLNTTL